MCVREREQDGFEQVYRSTTRVCACGWRADQRRWRQEREEGGGGCFSKEEEEKKIDFGKSRSRAVIWLLPPSTLSSAVVIQGQGYVVRGKGAF